MKRLFLLTLTSLSLAGLGWAQAPDNTGTNARDRSATTPTADQQSNAPADLKITAETRKMVMDDKALSALAKNAKIITIDEVVTLRGPVKSEKEKTLLEQYAQHAGAKKVVNLLEIKNS